MGGPQGRSPGAVARLPGGPGVYRFRDGRGRVLYIGRATSLRGRVASYWADLRDRGHLAPMVRRVARIEAVSCDSVHEAAWLERNLLETSLPPWNRTPGGQEVLVYIRMDERAGQPGLTVEHVARPAGQVRYFGPYLGGLRVRQAVAALDRVLPLSATGTRLRGTRLDMARARGAARADREELIAAIAAVLDRQPDAVAGARAELERRRDQAAGILAFELAGRVQAELEALDWVVSPQRVTLRAMPSAGELDVYGWSDDVLVYFGVRGGRLCLWSQRRCGQARAQAHLAATPADWADFAARNAELAAALVRSHTASQPGASQPGASQRGAS
jgi:excinuclease ABC subunit C